MSLLKQFEKLLKIAEKKEQELAIILEKTQRYFDEQKQKLHQLQDYEMDYHNNFAQQGQQGINGSFLCDYQNFLIQLKNIINQQRKMISIAVFEVERKTKEWKTSYQTRIKIRKLVEKYKSEENKQYERHQQKIIDELVSTISYRNEEN